ncbi:hypothetical protein ROZALSC1DRAFT_28183 [Rozella allomycis CSF55]|uniref:Glycosyltransferase 61 catalytic domain-containing protein n=1 Tax=Rozella allomycis (strain CSF55) TaxID=988480 RepID=A0A075AS64_ROZAC|nr:hypothetical protein O9G_000037 [Rozella allomycis CSF55]RKP20320.1 hypothetical protein ROZALSC1DRAFT_28183 [Rozella allomycis CSF55]|eukprot:EPZ31561.1 hypothetical protein O9G_000037 [Rozella allomycis CSF55]
MFMHNNRDLNEIPKRGTVKRSTSDTVEQIQTDQDKLNMNEYYLLRELLDKQKQEKSDQEIHKRKKIEEFSKKKEFPEVEWKELFDFYSNVWCTGQDRESRICKFNNLCYDPNHEKFIFIKRPQSVEYNVGTSKERSEKGLLDTTSISSHNAFYWDYVQVEAGTYNPGKIRYVEDLTFMFYRFLAVNIMHSLHDDFFNLFHTIREFGDSVFEASESFSRDNNILFLDHLGFSDYSHIFQSLTNKPLLLKNTHLNRQDKQVTCFTNAVVGISKRMSWYHYGFGSPQGPILNKEVDGFELREATKALFNHYNIPYHYYPAVRKSLRGILASRGIQNADETDSTTPSLPRCIVIYSRRGDRLILNEDELSKALEAEYSLPVKFLRMEDNSLEEQINILRTALIAIGMHGSMLIMSVFMPPGSILIELYPYAVPSENYTPYKTMSNIKGIDLVYSAWENKHQENNRPHPERPSHHGGIRHLSKEEQDKILNTITVPLHTCCTNPYWLFRIYQDTIVDIREIISIIDKKLPETLKTMEIHENRLKRDSGKTLPSAIKTRSCTNNT